MPPSRRRGDNHRNNFTRSFLFYLGNCRFYFFDIRSADKLFVPLLRHYQPPEAPPPLKPPPPPRNPPPPKPPPKPPRPKPPPRPKVLPRTIPPKKGAIPLRRLRLPPNKKKKIRSNQI